MTLLRLILSVVIAIVVIVGALFVLVHWPEQEHIASVQIIDGRKKQPPKQSANHGDKSKGVAYSGHAIPATPNSIGTVPSLYIHRFVMLDEWKMGWDFGRVPRSRFTEGMRAALGDNCEWFIGFNPKVGGCVSATEFKRIKEMGRSNPWGLPYADLLCYVQPIQGKTAELIVLQNCKAVPIPMDLEIARENQARAEREMQYRLNDLNLEIERLNREIQETPDW